MSVNPYLTPEEAPVAPISRPDTPETQSPQKRITNWLTMTGAIVGLIIGFVTATYPTGELAPGFETGRAYGRVLGHAIMCMLTGGISCWFLWLLFTRPLKALMLTGAVGLLVAFVVAGRVSGRSSADMSRHLEPGRAQAGDSSFSLQPPENWSVANDENSLVTYEGPRQQGFAPSIAISSFPRRLSFDLIELEREVVESVPANTKVVESGITKIDATEAVVVVAETSVNRHRYRSVKYLVPGRYEVFNVSTIAREPVSRETEQALHAAISSLRVD